MEYRRHNIVWQKWADPLGEDDLEGTQDETANSTEAITSESYTAEFYDEDGEVVPNGDTTKEEDLQFFHRPTRIIVTPMGIIPYTDNTASNKIFNFWVGHTNFDVTPSVVSIIDSYDGIETLDVFTRYRFRIGIGKLFNAADTMYSLSETIYEHLQ